MIRGLESYHERRAAEVRDLLALTPAEVKSRAGDHLVVCRDLDALHQRFANDIADEIETRNRREQPTRVILPVGPTGQYAHLVDRVRRDAISLARCHFFFMDEYCDAAGTALPETHPLSFKGVARRLFVDPLVASTDLDPARVVFPDETNVGTLAGRIARVGGIDTCYGGIGIHGHVAFNEPEPGVARLGPRKVHLNAYTLTINAIRASVGGNLESFPRAAFTLGMAEILGARRIRLYCRNGTPYDWANTVLRLALFGFPGDDYPVTHVRGHDYVVTTDEDTLAPPRHVV